MTARLAVLVFVSAAMAGCASNVETLPSIKEQCYEQVRPWVGGSLDDVTKILGPPNWSRDFEAPDMPGLAHWRNSISVGPGRWCGKIDVYTDAAGVVTYVKFQKYGTPNYGGSRQPRGG